MKNWLGQELHVGDVVYRGIRSGNTSCFKIGRVASFTGNDKVRVEWMYEKTGTRIDGATYAVPYKVESGRFGFSDPEALVVVPDSVLVSATQTYKDLIRVKDGILRIQDIM